MYIIFSDQFQLRVSVYLSQSSQRTQSYSNHESTKTRRHEKLVTHYAKAFGRRPARLA
jgi:hypothetical protein